MVTEDPKRPPFYSDKALRAVLKLANLKKRGDIGDIELYISPDERALVTTTTSRSVRFLIDAKYESEGSIVGSLDSITVHKNHEFRVWDEFSGCAVTCKFRKEMLDEVKRRAEASRTYSRNIEAKRPELTG